ncbi:MAG: helix-turn-helix domain-containing protein [Candidatus Thiodiazotropha taylori]|nr:helix-turn-helix domain-containing protein [Candidatus Thiodiazotropha taylori]MCW4325602.1 helix-turn-helix domain-containing protein [Candidatus Thiodiazotropha taylori]
MTDLSGKFVFAPIEVISDHRLGRIELRVLLALYSFRGKHDDCVYPHRETIAQRCGYTVGTVSTAITALIKHGWIERKQSRGPNTYFLKLPEIIAKQETVVGPDTVSDSETVSISALNSRQFGQETVTDVETPEQTKNRPIEQSPTKLKIPSCPHSQIIRLYHDKLPELPVVIESRWPGTQRAKDLQSRWREDKQHQNLMFWDWLFDSMRSHPFWLGENDRAWRADLGWIVKRSNFDKILQRAADKKHRTRATS